MTSPMISSNESRRLSSNVTGTWCSNSARQQDQTIPLSLNFCHFTFTSTPYLTLERILRHTEKVINLEVSWPSEWDPVKGPQQLLSLRLLRARGLPSSSSPSRTSLRTGRWVSIVYLFLESVHCMGFILLPINFPFLFWRSRNPNVVCRMLR